MDLLLQWDLGKVIEVEYFSIEFLTVFSYFSIIIKITQLATYSDPLSTLLKFTAITWECTFAVIFDTQF